MGVLIVHLWSLGKCWLFHRGSMQSSWRKYYVSESEGAQPLFCALSFAFAFWSAFLFLFTLVFLHAFPFYGTLWVAMLCSSGFKFLFLSFITLAYQLSFTFWFFRDVRIKNGKPKFVIWKFIFARAMNDDIIGQTQCHRWLSYHGCTLQADSPLNHARQRGRAKRSSGKQFGEEAALVLQQEPARRLPWMSLCTRSYCSWEISWGEIRRLIQFCWTSSLYLNAKYSLQRGRFADCMMTSLLFWVWNRTVFIDA